MEKTQKCHCYILLPTCYNFNQILQNASKSFRIPKIEPYYACYRGITCMTFRLNSQGIYTYILFIDDACDSNFQIFRASKTTNILPTKEWTNMLPRPSELLLSGRDERHPGGLRANSEQACCGKLPNTSM